MPGYLAASSGKIRGIFEDIRPYRGDPGEDEPRPYCDKGNPGEDKPRPYCYRGRIVGPLFEYSFRRRT
jgi:hypothetical protein